MNQFAAMAAYLSVPVIGFAGVLALLPKGWTHGSDGSVSNFGVMLTGFILLMIWAIIYHDYQDQKGR